MVEDIKELSPEAKSHLLGDVKLPLQGHVGLHGSESAQDIAPEITLLPNGRCGERCFVENLAAGILRAIEQKQYPGDEIGPGIKRGASGTKIECANNVYGRCGACQDKGVHGPAAEGDAQRLLRPGCGQIVGHASSERMADVKV